MSLGRKWVTGQRFPGQLDNLPNLRSMKTYHGWPGEKLTVVLDHGIISMAAIETSLAAAPHFAIVCFQIDHVLFQHQPLTTCTGHPSPPCKIALCLN